MIRCLATLLAPRPGLCGQVRWLRLRNSKINYNCCHNHSIFVLTLANTSTHHYHVLHRHCTVTDRLTPTVILTLLTVTVSLSALFAVTVTAS